LPAAQMQYTCRGYSINVGLLSLGVLGMPHWPNLLSPQHHSRPKMSRAIAWKVPIEISLILTANPISSMKSTLVTMALKLLPVSSQREVPVKKVFPETCERAPTVYTLPYEVRIIVHRLLLSILTKLHSLCTSSLSVWLSTSFSLLSVFFLLLFFLLLSSFFSTFFMSFLSSFSSSSSSSSKISSSTFYLALTSTSASSSPLNIGISMMLFAGSA